MRNSPFFDGVVQEDVVIAGEPAKVPIFYYEGTSITAIFPAHLGALKRLMPDPRYVPARIAPGVGSIGITAFEYKDTDIGAYNELGIAIPLNYPAYRQNIPGRAMVETLRRGQLHAYVHHLPVTTEIARAGGVDFYNYPKFIANIDFNESADQRECMLAEGEEHILTMRGKKISTPKAQGMRVFSHLYMNRQPQSSEFELNAPKVGISNSFGIANLELGGRHPIALELDKLLISKKSFHYQYSVGFEGILHGPDRITLPLIGRIEEARRQIETVGK